MAFAVYQRVIGKLRETQPNVVTQLEKARTPSIARHEAQLRFGAGWFISALLQATVAVDNQLKAVKVARDINGHIANARAVMDFLEEWLGQSLTHISPYQLASGNLEHIGFLMDIVEFTIYSYFFPDALSSSSSSSSSPSPARALASPSADAPLQQRTTAPEVSSAAYAPSPMDDEASTTSSQPSPIEQAVSSSSESKHASPRPGDMAVRERHSEDMDTKDLRVLLGRLSASTTPAKTNPAATQEDNTVYLSGRVTLQPTAARVPRSHAPVQPRVDPATAVDIPTDVSVPAHASLRVAPTAAPVSSQAGLAISLSPASATSSTSLGRGVQPPRVVRHTSPQPATSTVPDAAANSQDPSTDSPRVVDVPVVSPAPARQPTNTTHRQDTTPARPSHVRATPPRAQPTRADPLESTRAAPMHLRIAPRQDDKPHRVLHHSPSGHKLPPAFSQQRRASRGSGRLPVKHSPSSARASRHEYLHCEQAYTEFAKVPHAEVHPLFSAQAQLLTKLVGRLGVLRRRVQCTQRSEYAKLLNCFPARRAKYRATGATAKALLRSLHGIERRASHGRSRAAQLQETLEKCKSTCWRLPWMAQLKEWERFLDEVVVIESQLRRVDDVGYDNTMKELESMASNLYDSLSTVLANEHDMLKAQAVPQ